MSAFITLRGLTSSNSDAGTITGTFNPEGDDRSSVTIPDLIGKSRFVIDVEHTASGSRIISFIRYIDGDIVQYGKSGYSIERKTYAAGSDESAAYFDPATGTLYPYAVTSLRFADGSYYTYTYTIFG